MIVTGAKMQQPEVRDAPPASRDLEKLSHLCGQLSLPTLAEEARARLREATAPLMIYVVGPGNAGKSSLINAIAGRSIAPVGILPLTWKIDVFRRSDGGERAELHDASGSIKTVSLEEALDVCRKEEALAEAARARGERYASSLVEVTWWVDAPGLLPDFALIDTPGLSQERTMEAAPSAGSMTISVVTRNRAVELLHRADVIVWLMRANQLQTSANEDLVATLREKGRTMRRVIGVLTHWDRVSRERRQESLEIATRLFGEFITTFEPAVLKPDSEEFKGTIERIRGTVLEGDATRLKEEATRGYLREQCSLIARITTGRAKAATEGYRTAGLLLDDATRFIRESLGTCRHQVGAALDAHVAAAAAQIEPIASRAKPSSGWGVMLQGEVKLTDKQADEVLADLEKAKDAWQKWFENDALRSGEASDRLAACFDAGTSALADGLVDFGARFEVQVVREVDRGGEPCPFVFSLGRFSASGARTAVDAGKWRGRLLDADGFWEAVWDFLAPARDVARKRMRRALDAWRTAMAATIDEEFERAEPQLSFDFRQRVESAFSQAYGFPMHRTVPVLLEWDHLLMEIASMGGLTIPVADQGASRLMRVAYQKTADALRSAAVSRIDAQQEALRIRLQEIVRAEAPPTPEPARFDDLELAPPHMEEDTTYTYSIEKRERLRGFVSLDASSFQPALAACRAWEKHARERIEAAVGDHVRSVIPERLFGRVTGWHVPGAPSLPPLPMEPLGCLQNLGTLEAGIASSFVLAADRVTHAARGRAKALMAQFVSGCAFAVAAVTAFVVDIVPPVELGITWDFSRRAFAGCTGAAVGLLACWLGAGRRKAHHRWIFRQNRDRMNEIREAVKGYLANRDAALLRWGDRALLPDRIARFVHDSLVEWVDSEITKEEQGGARWDATRT